MTLIPEWMSNIHPLIVHFPIALLVMAILADFLSLILKRFSWIRPAALWLYVFGALGTIGAYITGKQAADVVHFPSAAYSVVARHADLALYTMLFFSGYALVRLFIAYKKWDQKNVVAIILFLVAAVASGLIQQTAERGGELVFRYGVGTNTQPKSAETAKQAVNSASDKIEIRENGSWQWQATENTPSSFRQNFRLLNGNWKNLLLQRDQDQNGNTLLSILPKSQQTFSFVFGPALKNVQVTTQINLSDFNGRFLLEYHLSANGDYDFLAVERGEARLGRVVNGTTKIFDTRSVNTKGWLELKAVSSNGHYRGYINDKQILHGHEKELSPGAVGFALKGSGPVRLAKLEVISLDNEVPMMDMGGQTMSHEMQGNNSSH